MTKIDGILLKQMIISGANNLYNNYPEVDALNVFPVPDGDTGTNMNLTISSGAKEIATRNDASVYDVAKAFSRGLLMGARGNSGVILSQIFRGFAQGLKGKIEATAQDISDALLMGKEVAYKAVMRPVEGTILTVIRESSQALADSVYPDMPLDEALDILLKEARESLKRTPNLLPVLKEAGVVDSGGAGLCKIIEGFDLALHNQIVEKNMPDVVSDSVVEPIIGNVQASLEHKEFGYCTEFILKLPEDPIKAKKKNFVPSRFSGVLNSHGNSIVMVHDDDLIKVHIHTLNPGNILTYAQQFGEFVKIKVENMSEQHTHLIEEDAKAKEDEIKKQPKKPFGLISVGAGKGIVDLFKDLNCDYIVSGGQTMNPSTEDFIKAIKSINAEQIFILPNNSNIIMAATQACDVMNEEVKCTVIPTKTIPQGLVSAMMYNPESDYDTNYNDMMESLSSVKSGQVTFAVKDTSFEGMEIHKDDFIGICDKKILATEKDKIKCALKLINTMIDEDSSIITIITGEDVTEAERDALKELVQAKVGDMVDVDVKVGLQPVYSFIIGIE
ncbi:MAG: DAK2 domain-containing protein [Bacilli bacterium]|jgi:DAK2 domain fusion protein yloV